MIRAFSSVSRSTIRCNKCESISRTSFARHLISSLSNSKDRSLKIQNKNERFGDSGTQLPEPIRVSIPDLFSAQQTNDYDDDSPEKTSISDEKEDSLLKCLFSKYKDEKGELKFSMKTLRQLIGEVLRKETKIYQRDNLYMFLLINGLAKQDNQEAAELAEEVVRFLEREYISSISNHHNFRTTDLDQIPLKPTVLMYTAVVDAWSRSVTNRGNSYGVIRAMQVLDRLMEDNSIVRPNCRTFAIVIRAIGKLDSTSDNGQSAITALNYFDLLKEESKKWSEKEKQENGYSIGEHVVNVLISTLAYSSHPDRVKIAENIFEEYFGDTYNIEPSIYSYNSLLQCYAMDPMNLISAFRASDLLERIKQKHNTTGDINIAPEKFTYFWVCYIWANFGKALSKMTKQQQLEYKSLFEQNNLSLDTCSLAIFSAQKCENLLRELDMLYQKHNDERFQPTDYIFHSVIRSWTATSAILQPEGKGHFAAQRAEEILCWMEDIMIPSVQTYSSVLDAWSRSGDGIKAARKAQALLDRYEKSENNLPSVISYNRVLAAWAHVKSTEGMKQTLSLLHRIEVNGLAPNITSYNIAFSAIKWSRDPDASYHGLALLQQAQVKLRLSTIDLLDFYTLVMTILLDANTEFASKEINNLFEEIMLKFGSKSRKSAINSRINGSLKLLFTSILSVNQGFESIKLCDERIKSLNESYCRKESPFSPQVAIYVPLLKSVASENILTEECIAWIFSVLHDMNQMHDSGNYSMRPTPLIYRLVIEICSKVRGLSISNKALNYKALKVAISAFDQSHKENLTTSAIYHCILHTCCVLSTGETRSKLLRLIFKQCCKDGLVNEKVLQTLRMNLDACQLSDIIGGSSISPASIHAINLSDFPASWSRNI